MKILSDKNSQVFILIFLCIVFYSNSLFNQYALDDEVVITENTFTKKGIKGIGDLVSHHLFYGWKPESKSPGIYRPVSLITFAIEYHFFRKNPFISHLINVALYCLSVYLLFYFLEKFIFKSQSLLSFLTTMIFAIHPIHTEVVSNIKSRDEILALIFILVSLIYYFAYLENKKNNNLIVSYLSFLMALFSKESAIIFVVVIPLLLYFFRNHLLSDTIKNGIPFVCLSLIYIVIKFKITGFSILDQHILNVPYMKASPEQAFATKTYVLFKYISLLFFPHPLSSDYSYNQIPYIDFSDLKFWVSIFVILALLIYAVIQFKKRSVISFSILFFFIGISIVSNYIIEIGAPLGERFLFTPSIAFAMAIGYMVWKFAFSEGKINYKFKIGLGGVSLILLLSGYKTISRNRDWKNNNTLFLKDVIAAPNSIRTLQNAATFSYFYEVPKVDNNEEKTRMINDAAIKFHKVIDLEPGFLSAYENLMILYFEQKKIDDAEQVFKKAELQHLNSDKLKQLYSEILLLKGRENYEKKSIDTAIHLIHQSIKYNPNNADAYWNLGGMYLDKKEIKNATVYWQTAVRLNPIPVWVEMLKRLEADSTFH
jgi:tetratricopeptide (TPR) repeat protein